MSASFLPVCAVSTYGGNVCWVMRHSQGRREGLRRSYRPDLCGANVRAQERCCMTTAALETHR